ncbi:MAG TPA: M56 family metallopeptidase [Acidimicrobiales bacterium]|nr:M56 family metallopeptidase [Acidimicrobiales bacterium]
MIAALVFGALLVALYWMAPIFLAGARWPSRAPRAAVALWQAIGVAGALCAIGAGLSVAVAPAQLTVVGGVEHIAHEAALGRPFQGLGLYAALGLQLATDVAFVLLLGLTMTTLRTARGRARHRRLLDLVARQSESAPGALLVDDARAAAYCLPGLRPRVVVSSGTLRLLSTDELGAVLAHEQGHAHGRHGIVLLPFSSLDTLLGWVPYARHARAQVAGLLEMAADDYAERRMGTGPLVSALIEMSTAVHAPSCAFSAGGAGVTSRVRRLMEPDHRSRPAAATAVALATVIVILPALALGAL